MILTALVNSVTSTGKFCYQYGNFENTEAATGGVLKTQINVLKNLCRISFLVKLKGLGLFKKKTLTQVFSCEIYENFKNTFLETYARVSFLFKLKGLGLFKKKIPTQVFSCEICENFKNTFLESGCFSKDESF